MAVHSANGVISAFVICLCACFLIGHKIDGLMTMEKVCELYSEGYIADTSDCKGWGYCRGGVLVAKGKCPGEFLYDSREAICNYPNKTECLVSKADMCKGENAVLKPDPENCNNYCYCNNGVTETGKCPANQYYNPNTQSCVWASTYPECIANSACVAVPDNKFVGVENAKSCSEYDRCSGHIGYRGNCKAGYVFNPSNGKCDKFTTMKCPDKPIETTPGESPPNTSEICKSYKPTDANKVFADRVSCPGYVICTETGKGVWQQCPWATHFDPVSRQCVTPYEVQCKYNRCKNMNISFMTAFDTGCKKYVHCDGQLMSNTTQSCSDVDSRYPYFAENLGGCVKDLPMNQKICQPVA